jgi:hypothetical protein
MIPSYSGAPPPNSPESLDGWIGVALLAAITLVCIFCR